MAGVLHCWKTKNIVPLEFLSIKNAEITYCWSFVLLEMLKQGMAVA